MGKRLRRVCAVVALAISLPAAHAGAPIDYDAMIQATASYLVASQRVNGLFVYGFDFRTGEPLEPDRMSFANVIRQAGAAYVLAACYDRTRDQRLRDPVLRALSALQGLSLPLGKPRIQRWVERTHALSIDFLRPTLLALLRRYDRLYEPRGDARLVSADGTYESATAGTSALALLAELDYAKASGDDRFAGQRSAWLSGLLDLRVPGAGFRRTPGTIDESDYYNGEGWLALAVYVDRHRDDARAAAALAGLDAELMDRYGKRPNAHFYHWGALTAAQRYRSGGEARFVAFLRSQAETFLKEFRPHLHAGRNHCADMEGVAATLEALARAGEAESPLARRLRAWLDDEAAALPPLQISPGQTSLVLASGETLHAPSMARYRGAFLQGVHDPAIRVDLAQHCLSAMMMFGAAGVAPPRR